MTGITLVFAAVAAVSIPVVSQLLHADDGQKPVPSVSPAPVIPVAAAPATSPAAPTSIAAAQPTTGPSATPATEPVVAASPAPIVASVATTAPTAVAVVPASPVTPPVVPATEPAGPPVRDYNGNPVDRNKVVITIGDEHFTAGDFDAFISELPPDQQAVARSDGRRDWADIIVKTKLLAQEAKARNLEQDARVRRLIDMNREQILAQATVNDVKEQVDDVTIRKFFEEHRAALERVQVRHILVHVKGSRVPPRPGEPDLTDEQARARADDICRRLKAGADFAKIAREESDDVGSGRDGGDIGSIGHGRKDQAFEQAAFALKKGEISQPVRSQLGWHVIQVVERFDTPEKLAEQIRAALWPRKTEELIVELKKSRKTEVDDSFFGPPLPPEGATTTMPTTSK